MTRRRIVDKWYRFVTNNCDNTKYRTRIAMLIQNWTLSRVQTRLNVYKKGLKELDEKTNKNKAE